MNKPLAVTPRRHGDWLVSPAFDLLFFANLGWLLALLPCYVADDGTTHVEFWQIYFLTTPHRWLTLLLVAADPERRGDRGPLFIALALLAAVLVGGVYFLRGGFICLLLIDYIWNGWHFASQHAGVLRMYARKSGGGRPRWEKNGLRLLVCYVIARTAGWTTGWLEEAPTVSGWLPVVDWSILALGAGLIVTEWIDHPGQRPGKLAYLMSVCGLYSALLLALMNGSAKLVLALTVAGAAFHAVEYIALVTLYAWRRQNSDGPGLFQVLAGHWLAVLAGMVLVLGSVAAWVEPQARSWWIGLNLWAAFLHYAYDGMIWKLRQPATAQALGVTVSTQPELATTP